MGKRSQLNSTHNLPPRRQQPARRCKWKAPQNSEEISEGTGLGTEWQWSEDRVHPLLIPNVLRNIFECCIWWEEDCYPHVSVLLAVRLLCKQWNDVATRLYRSERKTVSFTSKDNYSKLEKFIETMSTSSLLPVNSFSLSAPSFGGNFQRLWQRFLPLIATSVRKLKLEVKEDACGEFSSCFLFSGPYDLQKMTMPLLSDLEVSMYVRYPTKEEVEFIPQILKSADNLQTLKISYYPRYPGEEKEEGKLVANRMSKILCENMPNSVAVLDWRVGGAEMDYCCLKGKKLENLSYSFGDQFDAKALFSLLESQVDTLKSLSLHSGSNLERKNYQVLNLPQLPQLEYLALSQVAGIPASYPSPAPFPQLERLFLLNWNMPDSLTEHFLERCGSCPKLRFIVPPSQSDAEVIRKIAKSFPTLTSIKLNLSFPLFESALGAVFLHMTNLEELTLCSGSKCLDSVLGGVSEEDYALINAMKDFEGVDLTPFQKRPAITNLTKLRVLRMTASINDFAAHFLFLKMNSLEQVVSKCTCGIWRLRDNERLDKILEYLRMV